MLLILREVRDSAGKAPISLPDLLVPFVMQKGKAANCSGRPEDLPKRSMLPVLWSAADSRRLLQTW